MNNFMRYKLQGMSESLRYYVEAQVFGEWTVCQETDSEATALTRYERLCDTARQEGRETQYRIVFKETTVKVYELTP